jgi:diguanylate cyclase (GGDEF)-like protein
MDSERNELERRGGHDVATGLLDHQGLAERLDTAVALARRMEREVTLLLIDVAPLEGNVAPLEGGVAGHDPAAWRRVAAELTAAVRDHDLVARMGTSEFAVVLQASEAGVAVAIAERLLGDLKRLFAGSVARRRPAVSVGIATYPRDAEDVAALLRGASIALARARERGGGALAYAAQSA